MRTRLDVLLCIKNSFLWFSVCRELTFVVLQVVYNTFDVLLCVKNSFLWFSVCRELTFAVLHTVYNYALSDTKSFKMVRA